VRILANQVNQKRQGPRRVKNAKDVDQRLLEIHRIVVVACCRKTDQVRNRLLGMIENRVQKAVIDGDMSLGGRLKQRVGRNAFEVFRIENQIGSQCGATLLL
jgi:hypothetical protein